jgi:hypothetical protein
LLGHDSAIYSSCPGTGFIAGRAGISRRGLDRATPVGQDTLLKTLFGASHGYVSLEPTDIRAAALSDPRGLLALYPPPVIFDEVQYAPDLLPYVKEWIDAHRDRRGQYLLTGSQNLLMLGRVTDRRFDAVSEFSTHAGRPERAVAQSDRSGA